MKVVIAGCDHGFLNQSKEETCELEIHTFCPIENLIL